jgi:peptidyl-prolyl cis-trans isomerase B (cyclophilin B)
VEVTVIASKATPRRSLLAPLLFMAGLAMLLSLAVGSGAQAEKGNPVVKLTTSMGAIEVELYADKAPKSVANFLAYVKDGHYDGTIFHRVIDGFMIQGGGFSADLRERPTNSPIQNEADNGLKNEAYTLAMARTSDPHSATAQFFINVKDNDFLNHTLKTTRGWGYAVFGRVISGQEVVDKIKAVPTGNKGMLENVPVTPVTIIKAEVAR